MEKSQRPLVHIGRSSYMIDLWEDQTGPDLCDLCCSICIGVSHRPQPVVGVQWYVLHAMGMHLYLVRAA